MPSFVAGALAVGVISGAYQAEVFRGAYLAIHAANSRRRAASAWAGWLMFRRIIAPQVLRFAIPGLGNLWQVALKDSSLISVTGLAELMRVSQVGGGFDPPAVRLLFRRRRALSRHDSGLRPRVRQGRSARDARHARVAG